MKLRFLMFVLQQALSRLDPELLQKVADQLLDVIEDHVARSPAEWDDQVVLPVIKTARVAFNIPDNDEFIGEGS